MILNSNALLLEPIEVYNSAIIDSKLGKAVYSKQKVIECGIKIFGSWEDSLEWHEFNTFDAYMGEGTPIFEDEDDEL